MKKKLQMELADLRVESFTVDTTPAGRGTVHANESFSSGVGTCYNSCSGPVPCFCPATRNAC